MSEIRETIVNITDKVETTDENLIVYSKPSQIKEVAKLLVMQGARFAHLTAIDFINQKNQIELNYFFSLIDDSMNVIVKIPLEASELSISSISEIIPAVIWSERECNDLFGINFEGHPDPRRLVLPDNWPPRSSSIKKKFFLQQ